MYLLILFFPFLSFFSLFFFGFFLGKGIFFFSIWCLLCTLISILICYYEIMFCGSNVFLTCFKWFSVDSINFNVFWNFLFDAVTINMCFIIVFVSFLVHLYSFSYMSEDPYIIKFISFLSFFTFCMLVLVTAGNYIQMFLGWECVGLASYLLISFWNTRKATLLAGLKAMLINKIGDICLLISFVSLFYIYGSLNYDTVFCVLTCSEGNTVNTYFYLQISGFFLFFGAMGKSAQLGLHTWLPDAMEGPTPVSALIHAATMVTAGVFLLVRSSALLLVVVELQYFIILVGCFTAFFAASVAVFQNDIKKIIAYSTCSQLGYMFFSCGLLNFDLAFFHLVNHAFFKALLFLSAGVIIHGFSDEQDLRQLGGLSKILPVTYIMVCIGSFALMGFPFFTGFYSKDTILELALGSYTFYGCLAFGLGLLGAILTAFYSSKMLKMTFLVKPHNKYKMLISHEGSNLILSVLIILSFFSVIIGYVLRELFIGIGVDCWNFSFSFTLVNKFEIEFITIFLKLLPFFFSIFGACFGYFFFDLYFIIPWLMRYFVLISSRFFYFIFLFIKFFSVKWYFDIIYLKICNFFFFLAFLLLIFGDRGFLEYCGPLTILHCFRFFSNFVMSWSYSGYIYHYIYLILFNLICFITLLPIWFYTDNKLWLIFV